MSSANNDDDSSFDMVEDGSVEEDDLLSIPTVAAQVDDVPAPKFPRKQLQKKVDRKTKAVNTEERV